MRLTQTHGSKERIDRSAGHGVMRRLVSTALLVPLLVMLAIAPASAATIDVSFGQGFYVASLGQPLPVPLTVTVTDENGPVAYAEVALAVLPDSQGATATLSDSTAVTDENGVASVAATAGTIGGFASIQASVGGVTADVTLVIRPPGYRPGEQLASVTGPNDNGVTESIRDGLDNKTFLLIDVCAGWCGPCRFFAEETQAAIAMLATVGVQLQLVTLIMEGEPGVASTQADAQAWKQSNGLSDSVLHAEGSLQSEVYRAGLFFLAEGAELAYPTHLLVDPKGTILDRRVGAESTQQTIDRVLAFAKSKAPKKPKPAPIGEVTATLPDGQSYSGEFEGTPDLQDVGEGTLVVDEPTPGTWAFGYGTSGSPLPATGTLTTSLTRFKVKEQLDSSTVTVQAYMPLFDDEGSLQDVVIAATNLEASQRKGTVSVPIDLAALRTAIRTELAAGNYLVGQGTPLDLTPEVIDSLAASAFAVIAYATYSSPVT